MAATVCTAVPASRQGPSGAMAAVVQPDPTNSGLGQEGVPAPGQRVWDDRAAQLVGEDIPGVLPRLASPQPVFLLPLEMGAQPPAQEVIERDLTPACSGLRLRGHYLVGHRNPGLGDVSFEPTESYIWRAPDWGQVSPIDGNVYVIKAGDWLSVWDEYGWEMVKSGLNQGWSPEGGAKRRTPAAEALARLRR